MQRLWRRPHISDRVGPSGLKGEGGLEGQDSRLTVSVVAVIGITAITTLLAAAICN